MYQPLLPAQPVVNEHGVAEHPDYGDVYHSLSGALGQTDYVFLQGNGLPERWQGHSQFTICETGFGLGNNFLTTWLRWRQDPKRSQRLHFVSFEGHPLRRDDLAAQLHRSHSDLQPLAQQLLQRWPALLPGVHRLEFDSGQVSLTLVFGAIEQTAEQADFCADAFFLDGFSPRLNPAMWTRALFKQLVRRAAPGATLATWCTASAVRRDLQAAGFILQKRPGFAFKREMLTGQLRPHLGARAVDASRGPAPSPTDSTHSTPAQNYAAPSVTGPKKVAVVGGGVVGASVAYALAQRDIEVWVYDPVFAPTATKSPASTSSDLSAARRSTDAHPVQISAQSLLAAAQPAKQLVKQPATQPAKQLVKQTPTQSNLLGAAHAGHHALAMLPLLARQDPPRARLSRLGIALAAQRWADFGEKAFYLSPAVKVAKDAEQAAYLQQSLQQLAFDPAWVRWCDATELEADWGVCPPYGGLLFKQAYVVRPEALLTALLSTEGVQVRAQKVLAIHRHHDQAKALQWGVHTDAGSQAFDAVVLANAQGAPALLAPHVDPQAYPRFFTAAVVNGQVGSYEAAQSTWPAQLLLSGAGYVMDDRHGRVVLGSSYERAGRLELDQYLDAAHSGSQNDAFLCKTSHYTGSDKHGATDCSRGFEPALGQPLSWSASVQTKIEAQLQPFIGSHQPATKATAGWVGQRMALSDHRPVIDQVFGPEGGLWVAAAMGSNGFSWASAAAEQIAAQMTNEPSVLTLDLQRAVALR